MTSPPVFPQPIFIDSIHAFDSSVWIVNGMVGVLCTKQRKQLSRSTYFGEFRAEKLDGRNARREKVCVFDAAVCELGAVSKSRDSSHCDVDVMFAVAHTLLWADCCLSCSSRAKSNNANQSNNAGSLYIYARNLTVDCDLFCSALLELWHSLRSQSFLIQSEFW